MKRILLMLPLISMLFFASTPAKAGFTWNYLDGETAIVWALGGVGHTFIFFDYFNDIYTVNTTHSSNPQLADLGAGNAYAYYLDYISTNFSGDVYDVYIDTTGGGFFYVITTTL